MDFPPVPSVDAIAAQFCRAVGESQRSDKPYRHWKVRDVFPIDLCTGILTLPIAPPVLGKTDGTRNTYNASRCFIAPALRAKFPACQALAEALQRPAVARQLAETCEIAVEGGYVRVEYIQDIDGAWLEPHRDIPEKLFSMVVYLFTGPDAAEWGTDIYDADVRWIGRSAPDFNSGVIFVAGPATWHGFEPRPIVGVRRLMEINYARSDWRDREQLAFPDRPIRLG
jgi:hypothetical protein